MENFIQKIAVSISEIKKEEQMLVQKNNSQIYGKMYVDINEHQKLLGLDIAILKKQ